VVKEGSEEVRHMTSANNYKYLEPRTGTRFQQLFVKGKKYSAERIYRETVGEDARTPEQVAEDFELPLEAVLEAIHYSTHNEDLLRREREEELARIEEYEKRQPSLKPPAGYSQE
jgi:uncharacterized protein (DUF433 family)